jgi:hypothetical protein
MALIDWFRKQWHEFRGTLPPEEQSPMRWQDEHTPRAELHNILTKSTPATGLQPSTLPQELEKRRRTWLAQQKMEWLERKRAVWEADGKPISWAEWITRREYEWANNELPNRELRWVQQHNGKPEAIVA